MLKEVVTPFQLTRLTHRTGEPAGVFCVSIGAGSFVGIADNDQFEGQRLGLTVFVGSF